MYNFVNQYHPNKCNTKEKVIIAAYWLKIAVLEANLHHLQIAKSFPFHSPLQGRVCSVCRPDFAKNFSLVIYQLNDSEITILR